MIFKEEEINIIKEKKNNGINDQHKNTSYC